MNRCACGCGKETGVADRSDPRRGVKKGDPRRYYKGHGWRARPERHNMSHTPTHQTWIQIRARCMRESVGAWDYYGGRGINVCKRWDSFENFLADMGERPPGTSIDRLDVNGDYEPSNCRWATPTQQSNNRRNTKYVTYGGKETALCLLAREHGIHWCTLRGRLKRGWSIERALTQPIDARRSCRGRLLAAQQNDLQQKF